MAETTRLAPKSIGRYDVERLLGQGGMGRVWLARDTVLGRRVAIKVLRDDLALSPRARDELTERMRHEARAAAAVSHPNIVTLYDMGEDPAVGLFLVFEYVAGDGGDGPETLRERLRNAPLPLPLVARLANELGSALAFAHAEGVIHRDVKPENILFAGGRAMIADFGIARIPESTITRANAVLGTPAYTSPEALAKGEFGPRSDQFSLAATLYEAATRVRAFAGDDAIATAGKVSNDPPAPLDASIGSPAVVRALTLALLRGLAKDPDARFPSCLALGEAVSRAIDRTALSDPPEAGMLPRDTTSSPRIEVERTPLSSRVALAARISADRPMLTPIAMIGETPARPSLVVRKQAHRLQNIAAAIALLVIVVLILLGRKHEGDTTDTRDAASPAQPVVSHVLHARHVAPPSPSKTLDAGDD